MKIEKATSRFQIEQTAKLCIIFMIQSIHITRKNLYILRKHEQDRGSSAYEFQEEIKVAY